MLLLRNLNQRPGVAVSRLRQVVQALGRAWAAPRLGAVRCTMWLSFIPPPCHVASLCAVFCHRGLAWVSRRLQHGLRTVRLAAGAACNIGGTWQSACTGAHTARPRPFRVQRLLFSGSRVHVGIVQPWGEAGCIRAWRSCRTQAASVKPGSLAWCRAAHKRLFRR
jgi:hypothetical protein